MAFMDTLDTFGRAFLPKRWREPLREYLLKAGHDHIPYPMIGIGFIVMSVITGILHLQYLRPAVEDFNIIMTLLGTFAFWVIIMIAMVGFLTFLTWSVLNLRVYSRTKEMEDHIPDYLQLVITNLRSGISFDKSLWAAIRPEFGVLSKEIAMVSKKVMTGNDTGDALQEFAMRYDSPILRRSMNLIISEIESGGEIASVIERVVDNLRKTQQLKREMATSVVSYMMFIAIIVVALAPILFALANTILGVIISFADQIASNPQAGGAGSAQELFSSLQTLARSGDQLQADFRFFSQLALGTIALFSSMIVSIIEKGDIRGGLKYTPVFIVASLAIFWASETILTTVFGSLT